MSNLEFLNSSGFDAEQFDDFGSLPPGDYEVEASNSEMRDNKSGSGKHLYVELDVTSGDRAGAKLFDRFNLVNQNEQAVEIAQKQFANLCRACGIQSPGDSTDLHGIAIVAVVDVDGEYNRVKRYKALDAVPTESAKETKPKKRSKPVSKRTPAPSTDFDEDVDDGLNDDLPF